jgi:hypothetical protein
VIWSSTPPFINNKTNVFSLYVTFVKELGKGIQQDPQVALKNELIVFQVNVFVSAIVSFCCAFCWVLYDIMTISFYCFWECDNLRMQILIWLFSLGFQQIIICLSTPIVVMRLNWWNHDEGDGLILCKWHSQGYDPLIIIVFILVWPKMTQNGFLQNILLEFIL